MSYTSSVGIMPGAAPEKLPFIHSNFKPRTKLAKCFNGYKKHSGPQRGSQRHYRSQKLPQISHSGFRDNDRNQQSWEYSGGRSDYPGFIGSKKVTRKREDLGANDENQGHSLRSKSNSIKTYHSLPNWNSYAQQKMGKNNFPISHNIMDTETKRHITPQHDLNSPLFYYMDGTRYSHDSVSEENYFHRHNAIRFGEIERSYNRFSPPMIHSQTHMSLHNVAKGLDKKLRDARGKSGMKRDRRQEPHHVRTLGDVITAERLHELLIPKKDEGPMTMTFA